MWDIFIVLTKVGFYATSMAVIGAIFSSALFARSSESLVKQVCTYGLKSCGLAAFFCVSSFLIQVGSASQSGLSGLFDKVILPILWNSSVGDSLETRLIGLLFTGFGLVLLLFRARAAIYLAWIMLVIGTVLISLSFFLSGHTQSLGWLAQAAIAIHFLAVACWIGSLLPLYWSTKRLSAHDFAPLLTRFGHLALVFVIALIVAGGYLIFALLGSPLNLFKSTYGGGLILKFSLVLILLLLAARNRYSLVPQIVQASDKSDEENAAIGEFRVTVVFEMAFAFFILLVTALITSLTGPYA